ACGEGPEPPPRVPADAIASTRAARIDPDAADEHEAFDDDGRRYRFPQPEPQEPRAPRTERHVGTVRDHIEHPMAHDADGDHRGTRGVARQRIVDPGEQRRPDQPITRLWDQGYDTKVRLRNGLAEGGTS